MNTKEIASRLVELCRQGQFEKAQNELYSQDAVSIEPEASHGFEKETKGLDAIHKKSEQWNNMVEQMHGIEVSEPLLADNGFAVTMHMDVTMQGGHRMAMTELCSYRVKDGKIVSESFC